MFLKILQWLLDLVMNSRAVQWKSPYWAKLSAYSEDREKEASQDSRQRITKTCGDNSPSLHGSTAECHQPTTREQIATILTVASAVWDWSGLCTKLWVCVSLGEYFLQWGAGGKLLLYKHPNLYICLFLHHVRAWPEWLRVDRDATNETAGN